MRLLLQAVHQDAFTPAHAQLAADLQHAARAAGRERPLYDLLIAAHAVHQRVPLATLDRDYGAIEGLTVITR